MPRACPALVLAVDKTRVHGLMQKKDKDVTKPVPIVLIAHAHTPNSAGLAVVLRKMALLWAGQCHRAVKKHGMTGLKASSEQGRLKIKTPDAPSKPRTQRSSRAR
jgi:hypothetical protein